jgi:two-component system, OmpR family, sensor histidine kinase MprB
MGRPTLRRRLTILSTAAVAVAVLCVAIAAWLSVRLELRDGIESDLMDQSEPMVNHLDPSKFSSPPAWLRPDVSTLFGTVSTNGRERKPRFQTAALPVSAAEVAVAVGDPTSEVRDIYIDHVHYLMLTTHTVRGDAVQLAGDLTDVDAELARFAVLIGAAGLLAIVAAAAVGYGLTVAGLRPVYRVADAAAHVAATQDLDAAVPVARRETAEVASVATSVNLMLTALGQSRDAQRQLVEDASHELATPLTSLRTNVEMLLRAERSPDRQLDSEDKQRLLSDIEAQMGELNHLIEEVVELARDPGTSDEPVEVDLLDVVTSAVTRARTRTPDTLFTLTGESAVVLGKPAALERAVLNLLDNAAKWSPQAAPVEVTVTPTPGLVEVIVADRGPGVPESDLEVVFQRFHRTADARSMPGSGLGLAIVRQVAAAHGGRAWLTPRPPTGTTAHLAIPTDHPLPPYPPA